MKDLGYNSILDLCAAKGWIWKSIEVSIFWGERSKTVSLDFGRNHVIKNQECKIFHLDKMKGEMDNKNLKIFI